MEDYFNFVTKIKPGHLVNVVICFDIKEKPIICFENIVVVDYHNKDKEVLELDYINYYNNTYSFCFRNEKLDKLDFAPKYNCYFMVSKNKNHKEIINNFIEQLISVKNNELINIKNKLNDIKEEINNLTIQKT